MPATNNVQANVPSQTPNTSPPPQKKSGSKILLFLIPLFLILLAVGAFAAYKIGKGDLEIIISNEKPTTVKTNITPTQSGSVNEPVKMAANFAPFEEIKVNIIPATTAYKIDPGLTNVINKGDFSFSDTAQKLLVQNAFVVTSGYGREFFPIYEMNRYAYTPNFVTTDSILHNYHLFFNYLLAKLETNKFSNDLKSLNSLMLKASQAQYESLKNTNWANPAKRNVGFFSVASILLDPQAQAPAYIKNEVDKELVLIEAHKGIEMSPLMNLGVPNPNPVTALKEDYSQYIPRGHYDKTETLKRFFKSMMWYGRISFRMKSEDEVKSAILITLLLNDNNAKALWDKIYEPTNFFVGKSDDITFYQFNPLLESSYSKLPSVIEVQDQQKFTAFLNSAKKLSPPMINSMPIFQTSINPDREAEIKAFRFMGQRFTLDASIFQRLITREVGPVGASCSNAPFDSGRMLPKGLDIPAAMGSAEALNILKGLGETKYACYPENMQKMQTYTANLKTDVWTQNLYWGWLYSLSPLTVAKKDGYPTFMTNLAWARKDLNTYLGSWTELKHDTILYAKQVYAELGGGPPEKKDDRGYVEPVPDVFARLASLIKMTSTGLESRSLIEAQDKDSLDKMYALVISLKDIAQKELENKALSDADYELIRSYGGQLEHFWLEAMKNEGVKMASQTEEHPGALVADVATDPNGQVLEEGTGYINSIYVVFPLDGKLKIAQGGVFSYYEFPWPMSDRLTDAKWRELLDSQNKPKPPDWTSTFLVTQQ